MDSANETDRPIDLWVHWGSDKNPNDSIWRGKSYNHSRWHIVEDAENGRTVCGKNYYTADSNTNPLFEPVPRGEEPPDHLPTVPGKPIPVRKTCRRFGPQ